MSSASVPGLETFFREIYHYYCKQGFFCIVVQWVAELFTLGFTITFSGFLLLFVNWKGLLNCQTPCDIQKAGFYDHPLHPFTLSTAMILIYLTIFSGYWVFFFLQFFVKLKDTMKIQKFFHSRLEIKERELQSTSWPSVVHKLVQIQTHYELGATRILSAHDIVSWIMRRDNYLIGMLNKNVISMPLPHWLPGAGPFVGHDEHGHRKRKILTKTLEWSLNWCMLQQMFDRNFNIQRRFLQNPHALRKRFMVFGCFMLILSPFYAIFMLMYFFLRNAEQFYHQPSLAGSRQWSNVAKWTYREFNEVDHMLKNRLKGSCRHATEYIKQTPSPVISIVAKLLSFIAGAFAAVLLGIALLNESLLQVPLFGHELVWYAAICGGVLAVTRSLTTVECPLVDQKKELHNVSHYTHYMPKHWNGAEESDMVRAEFGKLFQLKGMVFLEEMASIFTTPFILWFLLPKCVNDILAFVNNFTTYVEGVGHVCSLSMFDFEHHGNNKYGSPFHASKDKRSSQGKMEKSFMSFLSNYPTWEPHGQGKLFLAALAEHKAKGKQPLLYSSLDLLPREVSHEGGQHSQG